VAETLTKLMHFGICVADVQRSVDFYCKGLDFTDGAHYEVGSEYGPVMGVAGELKVQSHFLHKDGFNIELLGFDSPGTQGTTTARQMNELGLTHLCISVKDVDGVAKKLEALGGKILHSTRRRIEKDNGWFQSVVFCTDPDGVRLEITEISGWGLNA